MPSIVQFVCVLMASPILLLCDTSNKSVRSEHILSGGGFRGVYAPRS